MPARRIRRNRKVFRKTQKKTLRLISYLFFIILIALPLIYIGKNKKFWNGRDKLSLAIRNKDSGVNLVVFDPQVYEIVNIIIPENTQVEVAEQRGVYQLKSVWELGKQEGREGELLTRTITRNFRLAVFAWADSQALGFIDANPKSLFRAVFLPYKSNLTLADKIGLALFVLNVKNPDRVDVDLKDTSYLKKTKLLDGEEGYVVSAKLSQRIISLFALEPFLQKTTRVLIKDATGKVGIAEEVGEIIEVLGAKVSSIERQDEKDVVCRVNGNENAIKILTMIFPCQEAEVKDVGNFDLVIELGRGFVQKY